MDTPRRGFSGYEGARDLTHRGTPTLSPTLSPTRDVRKLAFYPLPGCLQPGFNALGKADGQVSRP